MNTSSAYDWSINLLIAQGLLGAFDTLWHHELTQGLAHRAQARLELSIHAVRAILYGILFGCIANFEFHGTLVLFIVAVVVVEIALTLWDFVVEDGSRKLPASERVLHTVLAINGGALFALYGSQLAVWAHEPTALVAADLGWRGWLLSLFAAGVALSGIRDGLAARRLARMKAKPNPFSGIHHLHALVTGGTGFIGQEMVDRLLSAGHAVTVLTRDPLRAAYQFRGRVRSVTSLDQLDRSEHFDVVVNLAGAPILGAPWSERRKEQLLASRVGLTDKLVAWVKAATHKPRVWVQASAIGYYGVRPPEERLSERSAAGSGFMSELCRRWEASASPVSALGIREVVLRFGLVFGPGGALPALLMPIRLGVGAKLGDGRQVMSWIDREDVLRIVARAIDDSSMEGVYNAVAPQTMSQAEFTRVAGKELHRPVLFRLPAWPIRVMLGEMSQLLLDGQTVVPERLSEAGFEFSLPTVEASVGAIGS